ncbi:MAG: DUF2513 domain-containing protein [Lachnospiraceae bacterium]|nr:DUF2513 domain-containing protein [Lachnospiraceae bacterium]
MKLDLDCVRKVLLCVENNTGLRKFCFFIDSGLEESEIIIGNTPAPPPDYQKKLLKEFDNDTLIYHVNYCIEAGLLTTNQPLGTYRTVIEDLTPQGHSFLETIRDNNIWSGVKGIASKIGVKSLESVIQISSNVLTQLIKAQFGM